MHVLYPDNAKLSRPELPSQERLGLGYENMKMTSRPVFYLDAFTTQIFKGNPAAVCPLEKWISDELMQAIATENNLAETAFFVQTGESFEHLG